MGVLMKFEIGKTYYYRCMFGCPHTFTVLNQKEGELWVKEDGRRHTILPINSIKNPIEVELVNHE